MNDLEQLQRENGELKHKQLDLEVKLARAINEIKYLKLEIEMYKNDQDLLF
jgi:FtsZ-binding cell division protein ZapB